jgi:hypothetical protein
MSKYLAVPGLEVQSALDKRKTTQESQLTGISLPIKIVLGITVTTEINPCLLACWAVGKRNMIVGDVVEEVDFILF